GSDLFERLSRMPRKLKDCATRIFQGLITSADTVYVFEKFRPDSKGHAREVFSNELGRWVEIESRILRPAIRSGSIRRYEAEPTALLLFPYEVKGAVARLFSATELERDYPKAHKYLLENKRVLENREGGKFRDKQWYRFGRSQNLGMWEQPKLLIPYMITELSAFFDRSHRYCFVNVTTGGYGLTVDGSSVSLAYVCGLLNSRLLDFYLKHVTTPFRSGYFAASKQYVEQLPIRTLDFSKAQDKVRHDRLVSLVEEMQELKIRLTSIKHPDDKIRLQRRIQTTDLEIDHLVYDLYGVTEVEIASLDGKGENALDDNVEPPLSRPSRFGPEAPPLAEAARQPSEGGGGAPPSTSRARRRVHGVRERTGDYG
ncbi:MAG: TaqI-like C-terminal specificity domain-containing protein, partial [Terriglobia bacterium]